MVLRLDSNLGPIDKSQLLYQLSYRGNRLRQAGNPATKYRNVHPFFTSHFTRKDASPGAWFQL